MPCQNEQKLKELLLQVLQTEAANGSIPEIKGRRIVIYGAGELGKMAVDLLDKIGVAPNYIVDRDERKRGGYLAAYKIVLPAEINRQDAEEAIFIVCIVNVPYCQVKEYLVSLGIRNVVHFYDVTNALGDWLAMNNGWGYKNLTSEDKNGIAKVFERWEDYISRAHYLMTLFWRIKREEVFFAGAPVIIHDRLFPEAIIPPLSSQEIFVDCGAYDGNTINRFLGIVNYKFKKIIAYEPDQENFNRLKVYIDNLDAEVKAKIHIACSGVGDKNGEEYFLANRGYASRFSGKNDGDYKVSVIRLDDAIAEQVTFVKMHLEGLEYRGLAGALTMLRKCRPIIVVTLYHSEDGIWKVPALLMDSLEGYRFYHRVHGYCGVSSVLYAIPKEKPCNA